MRIPGPTALILPKSLDLLEQDGTAVGRVGRAQQAAQPPGRGHSGVAGSRRHAGVCHVKQKYKEKGF